MLYKLTFLSKSHTLEMMIFVEGVGSMFVIERGKVIGRREKRQFLLDFLHHRKKNKNQEKGDADVSTFFLIETGSHS